MDFQKMMRQAQTMQKQMMEAQKRIELLEVEGMAGGGMVTVMMEGTGRIKRISINPAVIGEEVEVLEDLMAAAFNDAWTRLEQTRSDEMKQAMGDAKLPAGLL